MKKENWITGIWNKYKRDIIIGVIVWGITSSIGFVINWILNESPAMGKSFIGSVVNLIYRATATYSSESVLLILLGAILGMFAAPAIVIVNVAFKIVKKQKSKEEKEELEKNNTKKIRALSMLLIVDIIFVFVFVVSCVFIPASLYEKFNRDLTIIRPYVEEKEVHALQSEWVLMKGKDDYIQIYEDINSIKEEHSLPKK